MDYDPIIKTWSERRILTAEHDTTPLIIEGVPGISGTIRMTIGQLVYPGVQQLVEYCGGTMARTLNQLAATRFGRLLSMWWAGRPHVNDSLRQFLLEQDIRYGWHTAWWEIEGHRIYILDEVTGLALAHTRIDNYPTELLRLPVRSFYLRVPEAFGWRCDLPEDWEGSHLYEAEFKTTPELKQPLDGFQITGEYDESDRLRRIHVLLCGRGTVPEQDNVHWFELSLDYPTLGEVLNQSMVLAQGAKIEYVNREAMQVILGTILYITSAHPELHPIPSLPKPQVSKKKKHREVWKAYENQSKYKILMVGGPTQGFRKGRIKSEISTLQRKPPKPHRRDGHWRWQAIGPRGEGQHKHMWIQPISIGDWDRIVAWESVRNMQVVIRKTRPAELPE